MVFVFPWILPILPAALLFLRKRKPAAIAVSGLAGWKGVGDSRRMRWRGRLRFFYAAAAALLLIALAGPRIGWKAGEDVHQGIAIEVLFDISASMSENVTAADGTKTTRVEAGKKALEAFINNRRDDLTGLITFARYADTRAPLTFGHDAVAEIVRGLTVQELPNEDGTAYGDALSLACARLRQFDGWKAGTDGNRTPDRMDTIQSKVIILFTDGENNCGVHLPLEAAALAKKWGIRIYAIKMTDSDVRTAPASGETGNELNDAEKLLRNISVETGGEFWKIHNDTQLAEVYTAIDRLEKSRIKNTTVFHTVYAPLFSWFVLPALFLLVGSRILEATVLRVAEEVQA